MSGSLQISRERAGSCARELPVVAGPACRASVSKRLRDAALVVLQRSGADGVRDPVAIGLDRLIGHLVAEQVERLFRALAIGDVAERLPAAIGVEAAL